MRNARLLLFALILSTVNPSVQKIAKFKRKLKDWSVDDVVAWFDSRGSAVPAGTDDMLRENEIDGPALFLLNEEALRELWSDFAESNFTSSFQGRRIETNRRARATLRVVNGLVSGQDIPPSDFWTWRKVHRKRAILYPIFLVRSPRLALLYISIFDGALLQDALTVDPKAALMDAVLPARAAAAVDAFLESPPDGTVWFWLGVLLEPHAMIAWHAVGYFSINFWVTACFVTTLLLSIGHDFEAVQLPWLRALRRLPSDKGHTLKDVIVPMVWWNRDVSTLSLCIWWQLGIELGAYLLARIILFLMFSFIEDAIFHTYFAYLLLRTLTYPLRYLVRSSVRARLHGACLYALLGVALIFDDDYLWDAFLYLLFVVPGVVITVRCSRIFVGAQLPSQIPAIFMPVFEALQFGLPPLVKINDGDLLRSSIVALSKIPAASLQRGLNISYVNSLGVQEEGIDAGGLSRDWLYRVAQELFDARPRSPRSMMLSSSDHRPSRSAKSPPPTSDGPSQPPRTENGGTGILATRSEQIDGHHVFRFAKPTGIGPAKAIDETAVFGFIGKLLALALNKTLAIGARINEPQLRWLCHTPSSWPKSRRERGCQAADLKFVSAAMESRLSAYVASRDAASIEACDLEFVSLDGRRRFRPPPKDSSSAEVTLDNCLEFMAALAEHELFGACDETTLAVMRDAFLGACRPHVYDLLLPDVAEVQRQLAGTESISVNDWKRATTLEDKSGRALQLEAKRVYGWFWRYVEDLDNDQSVRDLLFWITSMRELRHVAMTIKITQSQPGSLPVAHTCVCTLEMPLYETYEALRDKLAFSVTNGRNFGIA